MGNNIDNKAYIKKKLLDLLYSEKQTITSVNMQIEQLMMIMLNDYAKKQGKDFEDTRAYRNIDACFPNGIDDYIGITGIEIKNFGRHFSESLMFRIMDRILKNEKDIQNLIIILFGEVGEKEKKHLNYFLYRNLSGKEIRGILWDIDNVVDICAGNVELFDETISKMDSVFLEVTVDKAINQDRTLNEEKKKNYINEIKEKYMNDDLVLFLGAGASQEAKIATWDNLIADLFVALVDNQLNKRNTKLGDKQKNKIIAEIGKQNQGSPLMQVRFIKQGIGDEFEEIVRKLLYKGAIDTSPLLKEIGKLCIPNRGKIGIKAIINYNFDDLVEKTLKSLNLKYCSIYSDGVIAQNEEIGIHHVHGFLPENKDEFNELGKSLLVFSEEGYHKLMLEPYNWANMTQLNFLINNTCLFIGLSMTDPNLRRLLEISAQKNQDEKCKHYAIMKRFVIDKSNKDDGIIKFEQINEELQETFYKELGVNIIWVDDFSDIPKILGEIKKP